MKRDLTRLTDTEFDIVVVGGGIFGICIAWDAISRGLSVALVERGDFSGGTSAHCFKIVHGGIRYIQHGDVPRIRESSRERRILLRIAPHLVKPLPILIPTYGHGLQGKPLLITGARLYELLIPDRNRGIRDPDRKVPLSRTVSREECLRWFPDIDTNGLTGGVIVWDGQMYSPPRLALSFLRSAADAGAAVANYVEATGFLREGSRIVGISARDSLSDRALEIRGRVVVNAAGAWAEALLERTPSASVQPPSTFSRDACFVIKRRLPASVALAVQARTRDPDAVLSREARHLFLVPWRDYTLVGVWHTVYERGPDSVRVTEPELQNFIDELNSGYPGFDLTLDDVTFANAGLVLFGKNEPGATHLSYGKRSRVIDHAATDSIEGLITVIGVRFTTGRAVAERVVDLVFGRLGYDRPPSSNTDETPVHGGEIGRFDELTGALSTARPHGLDDRILTSLAHNYGSEYGRVLGYAAENPDRARPVAGSHVIEAEVVHAVRQEMAMRLGDVLFRRTDLATGEHPGQAAIEACAHIMGQELGWSSDRFRDEIDDVNATLERSAASSAIPAKN